MMKYILCCFALLGCLSPFAAAAQFKPGTQPLVDGVYASTQAVITGRNPVFSWEYTGTVSSFTITVSADAVFSSSGELWNFIGSTTMPNTMNLITRIAYNSDGTGAALIAGITYFWEVTIYGDGVSQSASSIFTAVTSAVTLPREKFDLAVDWNNPFNPTQGQQTAFRYIARDHDRRMQLRVFTLSGELVRDWPERPVLMDTWYSETWDGKNNDGETVARGMYLVNLKDVGDQSGVTRRIGVLTGKP